jgi:hypothetical protein
MIDATDYRNQAAACRRAANMSRQPSPYLLDLAEYYDRQATQLDARFAGDKPGAMGTCDTDIEKPRR